MTMRPKIPFQASLSIGFFFLVALIYLSAIGYTLLSAPNLALFVSCLGLPVAVLALAVGAGLLRRKPASYRLAGHFTTSLVVMLLFIVASMLISARGAALQTWPYLTALILAGAGYALLRTPASRAWFSG